MSNGRRDARYSIRFPCQLTHGKKTVSLLTEDVSERGVFLCTDSPPPLLQLVQVKLVLPIGDRALKAHGMTVHVVERDNAQARTPGIGVQFYALDADTRGAWLDFVRHVEENYPRSPDQAPLRLYRGAPPAPMSRRFEKHTAVLRIQPATLEDLEEIYTRDLCTGSMFVSHELVLAAGTNVVVHIAHPGNGQPFLVEAKVTSTSSNPPGLALELVGIDRAFREDFLDFVRGGVLIDDDEIVDDSADRPSRAD